MFDAARENYRRAGLVVRGLINGQWARSRPEVKVPNRLKPLNTTVILIEDLDPLLYMLNLSLYCRSLVQHFTKREIHFTISAYSYNKILILRLRQSQASAFGIIGYHFENTLSGSYCAFRRCRRL